MRHVPWRASCALAGGQVGGWPPVVVRLECCRSAHPTSPGEPHADLHVYAWSWKLGRVCAPVSCMRMGFSGAHLMDLVARARRTGAHPCHTVHGPRSGARPLIRRARIEEPGASSWSRRRGAHRPLEIGESTVTAALAPSRPKVIIFSGEGFGVGRFGRAERRLSSGLGRAACPHNSFPRRPVATGVNMLHRAALSQIGVPPVVHRHAALQGGPSSRPRVAPAAWSSSDLRYSRPT